MLWNCDLKFIFRNFETEVKFHEKIKTMENSISENEIQQSFRSPPRRRRSTFFERRESMAPQALTENLETISCKKDSLESLRTQNLNSYYEKLLLEKDQWKKEVNDRRNKYHDLRQQFQITVKAPSRSIMSYSALSNDDIEFLKAKPNLSKLIEAQQKLHKSVKEVMALVHRTQELDDIVLRNSEEKVTQITEYILENSTVEPLSH